MPEATLQFSADAVSYFHDSADVTEKVKLIESQHRGMWQFLIEAFACHCVNLVDHVRQEADKLDPKPLTANDSEINLNSEYYFCVAEHPYGENCLIDEYGAVLLMSDEFLIELGECKRGNAEDVAKMNWYAFVAAKKAVSSWVLHVSPYDRESEFSNLCRSWIDQYEWQNIKQILSYSHLFDYPRPSSDRVRYLKSVGVTKIPLSLS
jgi:hypothetical protein